MLAIGCLLLLTGCVSAMERREVTYDSVRSLARERAEGSFEEPEAYLPEQFRNMNYDAYRNIRFRSDQALWLAEELPFQAHLFHRGYLYNDPVFLHEYTDSHVQELPYVRDFFRFDNLDIERFPRRSSGYAGWRLHAPINSANYFDEVIAFLGASYFRAVGKNQNYGISARGILLPHPPDRPEEFPAFVEFWLRKPEPGDQTMTALALLDGPSVTGAYQFRITPGDPTRVDVAATLFPREPISEIGLGALTSMFYYGENTHPRPDDFRPEVHDSDGLSLQYADKAFVWRPLVAAQAPRDSRFPAAGLVAFGLYQRDRSFDHYLDDESRYKNRPSVRVLLGSGFSEGKVFLRELPPDKEFGDNIVAAFIPDTSLEPGRSYRFDFSMHWGEFRVPPDLGHVTRTRHGKDIHQPETEVFLVEFTLPEGVDRDQIEVAPQVSDNARMERVNLSFSEDAPVVRVHLHVRPSATGPVDLSLQLKSGEEPVTEKWVYLWSRYN